MGIESGTGSMYKYEASGYTLITSRCRAAVCVADTNFLVRWHDGRLGLAIGDDQEVASLSPFWGDRTVRVAQSHERLNM